MDWFSSKLKYFLIIVIIVIVGILLYQYNECMAKGKLLGGAYKCGFFSKQPVSILPIDEYYDVRAGECYHYTDYGNEMSIKKVDINKCNN